MVFSPDQLLIKMIRKIDFFQDISDQEVLDLAKRFELKFFMKKDVVVLENQKPQFIYICKDGRLIVKKAQGLAQSIVLGYINSGDIFGEMSYLKNTVAMASVVSEEESNIWKIPIDLFEDYLNLHPHIRQKVENIMKDRDQINTQKMSYEGDTNSSQDGLENIKFDLNI